MSLLKKRWLPLVRAVALGLVLGLLLTPIGMAHVHLDQDTSAYATVPAPPGTDAIGAMSIHSHDHCLTCDWLQAFGSTIVATAGVALGSTDTFQLPCPLRAERRLTVRISVPARAPPSDNLALS
jgi:hypothetical protein